MFMFSRVAKDRSKRHFQQSSAKYSDCNSQTGLDPWEVVTVVKKIEYEDSQLDASWALGSAIESVSSLSSYRRLMYVV